MSSRDRNLLVGLGILILVLGIVVSRLEETDAADVRPSTYVTSDRGVAALYMTLEELSIPVARRLTPFDDGVWTSGVLVLLAPVQVPTPLELHALAEWIREGGTLVYAADYRGDAVLDTLGLDIRLPERGPDGERDRSVTGLPTNHPLAWRSERVDGFRWVFDTDDREDAEVLLLSSAGETLALRTGFGRGQIIAFSDVRPFLNGAVEQTGGAPIFVQVLASTGDQVVFDEYHHGFREGGNVVAATIRFLTGTPAGRTSLQIGVAALGLVLLAGARFGSPIPAPPALRRNPLEHVEALAHAYQRANARRSARQLMLAGLTRRLGRTVSEPDEEQLFDNLRRSTPARARAEVTALEDEWKRGDAADLAALARHMDAIVKESRRG